MAHGTASKLFSLAILFLYLLSEIKSHFLSIEDLEEFYDLEEKLVSTFTTYIEEQKQILDVVKQRYEEHKRWQPVLNNTDEYLSNPLNVHAMLKRLVSDWPLTMALLGGFEDDEEEEDPIKLPSIEEYRASVHGIARLQQVYHYSIQELVSGSAFPGTDNTSVLTADDCLAVGRDLYENKHFQLAIDWFKEALTQATNQTEGGKIIATNTASDQASATPPVENIYEYLALATCFTGDQRKSKKYFNRLYSEFPEFRPTQNLIKDHLLAINDTCRKLINNESLKPKDHKLNLSWSEDAALSADYARLCKAEVVPVATRPLKCWLVDWGEPYWLLQPFKMEVLHYNPDIYLTYDIISPSEGQFIMENMMDEGSMSMTGFVYEFWKQLPLNSSVSESLVRRTEWVSGSQVHNTRGQVLLSSIPVGAEYVVDKDLDFKMEDPENFRAGSTVFFLEQPQAGGLVVFPRLGLSVAPKAGAALTWFNINEEGKVDERTVYGTCPVIQGHETMLTLWFKNK